MVKQEAEFGHRKSFSSESRGQSAGALDDGRLLSANDGWPLCGWMRGDYCLF